MYTIIDKITCVENTLVFTDVGYTESNILVDEINLDYDNTLGAWTTTNLVGLEEGSVLVSEFFSVVQYVFSAKTTSTVTSGLPLITNTGELI